MREGKEGEDGGAGVGEREEEGGEGGGTHPRPHWVGVGDPFLLLEQSTALGSMPEVCRVRDD